MTHKIAAMLVLAIGMIGSSGCQGLLENSHQCNCNHCNPGCRPGPIGWQRGGLRHGRTLNTRYNLGQAAAGSGVTSAQVAYPYYTSRGPRDFLQNNPPTIGR